MLKFCLFSYDDDDGERIYNNLDNSFDDDYEDVYGTLVECAAVKVCIAKSAFGSQFRVACFPTFHMVGDVS